MLFAHSSNWGAAPDPQLSGRLIVEMTKLGIVLAPGTSIGLATVDGSGYAAIHEVVVLVEEAWACLRRRRGRLTVGATVQR